MPGYTYFFVDTVPKQCICPICKLPMQSPIVLTSCRHTFCDSCLRPRQSNGRASTDMDGSLMCPIDEQMTDQRTIHASTELREAIESCMVRCPQEAQGCHWVDVVKHVPTHLESCKYVAVPCPENCGELVSRGFLKDHLGRACSQRRRECPFCRCALAAGDFQKHEGTCPEEQVWCENKCGQRMPRRRLARHESGDCSKREVSCTFCKKRFLYDSLQVHIQQCTLKGSTGSAVSTSTSTSNSSSAVADPGAAVVGSGALSAVVSPTTAPVSDALPRQPRAQQPVEQPLSLPPPPPPPVPRRAASAECLDAGGVGGSGGRGSDCPLRWCGCQFKGDRSAMERHQKEAAARHVTLLADLVRTQRRELDSLRRQLRHLPLVHTGHLVWRIDSYLEKLAESRANQELEFCSVPFYTGRPGYRLQASVFLNGNGNATGRYLSLYVKLLPGEFDPILDWPFDRPIRMRLLDQSEARRHLEESFAPDPTWRHFRRPAKDAGAAFGFGFPRFASHELLACEPQQQPSYVLDNVLFLEIHVLQTQ